MSVINHPSVGAGIHSGMYRGEVRMNKSEEFDADKTTSSEGIDPVKVIAYMLRRAMSTPADCAG